MTDTCPNGCDLQAQPIPQQYIDARYYGNKTHYSRRIAVELRGVYDGAVGWFCPDCGVRWLRLPAFADHPRVQAWLEGKE